MEGETTYHKTLDPIKVKLIKGQKDTYGFEISVQGNNRDEILAEIASINNALRASYKGGE